MYVHTLHRYRCSFVLIYSQQHLNFLILLWFKNVNIYLYWMHTLHVQLVLIIKWSALGLSVIIRYRSKDDLKRENSLECWCFCSTVACSSVSQKGRRNVLAKRVRNGVLRCLLCIEIKFASECMTIEYLFLGNYNLVQCKQNLNFSSSISCCLIRWRLVTIWYWRSVIIISKNAN